MWRIRLSGLAVCLALIGACSDGAGRDETDEQQTGAATSLAAVDELVAHLSVPDFELAADLAMPGHAALASLAEGATPAQVADAIETGDRAVAANFWAGFAQGAGAFLSEPSDSSPGDPISEDGVEFEVVELAHEDGVSRRIVTQSDDGYRVDLFASFGAGLAERMLGPVERLVGSSTADAEVIVPELVGIVPSLRVATNQPGITTEAAQDLLLLIEVITRVS